MDVQAPLKLPYCSTSDWIGNFQPKPHPAVWIGLSNQFLACPLQPSFGTILLWLQADGKSDLSLAWTQYQHGD
jgi:hypothetical protein